MKLSVLERISASGLLPDKGTFANLKLLRVAQENLSFNEEENGVLKFRQEDKRLFWEDGVVKDKEIELGEVVTQLLVKELKKLNETEELKIEHETLYEKFVG